MSRLLACSPTQGLCCIAIQPSHHPSPHPRSGLHLVDPASGDVRTLQVVRLYHSADIQGYGAQLLVRAHKDAAFPAPGRKVPAAKLADPDAAGAYPRFSEAGVAEVRRAWAELCAGCFHFRPADVPAYVVN